MSVLINLLPYFKMGAPEISDVHKVFRSTVIRDGLKVEQSQRTFFRVLIASAEAATPVLTRMIPAAQRATFADPVPDDDQYVVAELMLAGQKDPVWRVNLGSVSELGLHDGPTVSTDELQRRIEALVVPYYIPQDDSALALPVVVH